MKNQPSKTNDKILLVGFPSNGLVGTFTISYLVHSLKMNLIGEIEHPDLPPTLFIENGEEGLIKVSLRSKGSFDVNSFARAHFNGGGHLNAAGGRIEKSLEETASYFESLLENYKSELAS